jgi:hypothetical protein
MIIFFSISILYIMKVYGNIVRPLHIFMLLLGVLLLVSLLLGDRIIEGLTGDSSTKPNIKYDPSTFDNTSSKPAIPDFSKPLQTGDPNEVGFGVAPGDLNEASDAMNPNGGGANSGNAYDGMGIPKSQIPRGEEDLYILKSQIVPPVCPACPTVSSCPRKEPCPSCPACARCPEPSFECKKVPNYSSNDDRYLPRPVLADFSQFGM